MTAMTLEFTQSGKKSVNVYDVFLGAVTPVDALTTIGDAWVATGQTRLTTSMQFSAVTIGGDVPVSKSYAVNGGQNNTSASINTCFLVDKNPDAGRRGRVFLAGVGENVIDPDGSIDGPSRDALTVEMNAWLDACTLGGVILRIKRTDLSFDLIESFSCQSLAATQRRRMRR